MLHNILNDVAAHASNWLVLLAICWLLKRILDKQYESFRDDQARTQTFAAHAMEVLDKFSDAILKGQSTILLKIEDASHSTTDKILGAVAEITSANNEATGNIILSLQIKENRTVAAIEKLLVALREDLSAIRPAPPVGGTGSQVRDGGTSP